MQVLECLDQFNAKQLHLEFWHLLVLFYELIEVMSTAILKDDPEMVPRLIPVVKLENSGVIEIMKDSNLTDQSAHLPRSKPSSFEISLCS